MYKQYLQNASTKPVLACSFHRYESIPPVTTLPSVEPEFDARVCGGAVISCLASVSTSTASLL